MGRTGVWGGVWGCGVGVGWGPWVWPPPPPYPRPFFSVIPPPKIQIQPRPSDHVHFWSKAHLSPPPPSTVLMHWRYVFLALSHRYIIRSRYSTRKFCRGVSDFATDCPCMRRGFVAWINHLPPVCWSTFWKSTFKQQLGCGFDIMDCKSSWIYWYFDICNCIP